MLTQHFKTHHLCHIDRMGDISCLFGDPSSLRSVGITEASWVNRHIIAIKYIKAAKMIFQTTSKKCQNIFSHFCHL